MEDNKIIGIGRRAPFAGLDQQGRYVDPWRYRDGEAADAATEIGADDEARPGEGAGVILWPLAVALAGVLCAALFAAFKG